MAKKQYISPAVTYVGTFESVTKGLGHSTNLDASLTPQDVFDAIEENGFNSFSD